MEGGGHIRTSIVSELSLVVKGPCEGHVQFCSASLTRLTCAHFEDEITASAAGPKMWESDQHGATCVHWGVAVGAHCPRLFNGDLVGIFC